MEFNSFMGKLTELRASQYVMFQFFVADVGLIMDVLYDVCCVLIHAVVPYKLTFVESLPNRICCSRYVFPIFCMMVRSVCFVGVSVCRRSGIAAFRLGRLFCIVCVWVSGCSLFRGRGAVSNSWMDFI